MDFVSWVLQRLDTLLPDVSARTTMDSPPQLDLKDERLHNYLEPDVQAGSKNPRRTRRSAA